MALGRRDVESQGELWVATKDVACSPGHVFYERLNRLLGEAGFDEFVEELCEPFYAAKRGRPGIPPGTYKRRAKSNRRSTWPFSLGRLTKQKWSSYK